MKTIVSISQVTPSQYKNFSCQEPALDEYLKRFAKNHEKINIGRTFVLLNENANPYVVGYYTLNTAQIHISDLPETMRKKLPKYPIPASRLCRLAIDHTVQKRGLGEYLLVDAMRRVLRVDATLAIHSLIVDSKNERAKKFYMKYGFLPLNNKELTLFIPIATIREAVLSAEKSHVGV